MSRRLRTKRGYPTVGKQAICILLSTVFTFASGNLDTFGIARFFPTKAGTREWNSAHWNNGIPRNFKYAPDPYDPTGWTEDHSGGSDGFRVDGAGMMRMSGSGPRFHINSLITTKVGAQRFRDVEFTCYYRRLGTNGANWGGCVVGLRSGPLGHASAGGDDCDATTYYARFRNDGKWDFEKELKHPGSSYWSGSGFNTQDPLWHGAKLPVNRWIGMKYLAVNTPGDSAVKLSVYIDSVSNGNPQNGGHWEKVGEVVDAGAWPSGDVGGCDYPQNMVITEGGGTMLMRTDNDTADYTMVSVREIDVTGGPDVNITNATAPYTRRFNRMLDQKGIGSLLDRLRREEIPFAVLDLRGRELHGKVRSVAYTIPVFYGNEGIRLLVVGERWRSSVPGRRQE